MIFALLSLLTALAIAFGRHTAVFAKVKASLWFFSNFERKRLIFSLLTIVLGGLAFYQSPHSSFVFGVEFSTFLLLCFAFVFDMKYVFPEVNKVIRKKATAVQIAPDAAIVGLAIGKKSVAYPLDVLIPNHLILDKIGEDSVLISFCALCQSALAFDRKINNDILYFKVAGVWRRNMIMYDTKSHSLWQQATGLCIYGSKKGQQLPLLSGENTNWEAWSEKHPQTEFAADCIPARKGYLSREFMLKSMQKMITKILLRSNKAFVPGYADLSDLPVREMVFGIHFNGIDRAYPISKLDNITTFIDDFGGQKINCSYNPKSNYLTATEAINNQAIIVEKHWWLGWKEFHMETEIWQGINP